LWKLFLESDWFLVSVKWAAARSMQREHAQRFGNWVKRTSFSMGDYLGVSLADTGRALFPWNVTAVESRVFSNRLVEKNNGLSACCGARPGNRADMMAASR
jgi:hypothetical protein